ncbi:MAG: tRNA (adenosine(37)-N6)-dimethylallyltransferase MiaA [Reichenbachiella sp.]
MITILGPTATGKTSLAVALAQAINGEIISADSRQIYRGMDIGTGKDLSEYQVDGTAIAYHLINLYAPGYEYNVFEFQNDFLKAYEQIITNQHEPILCGGTGMYIDAILKGYKLIPVPKNEALQAELDLKEHEELIQQLQSLTTVHNTTDLTSKKRTIRAIELELYCQENSIEQTPFPSIPNTTFGIQWDREIIKKRITQRLKDRLQEGMIEEVKGLLGNGISSEALKFYGLEYKFITLHIEGELTYNDMYQKLNTAIHQFAKRQMTWFRRMEKQGTTIHWIEGSLSNEEKVKIILSKLEKSIS